MISVEQLIESIEKHLTALGALDIVAEQDLIQPRIANTFDYQPHVDLIVSVYKETQIPPLLKLANEHDCILVPASSGQNWGYGTVPVVPGGRRVILLSLINLKDIQFVDKSLGIVSIEPGVTQQDLYDFLQKEQSPFMVPVTGAGPTCCILSNALERGYGITPIASHFDSVLEIEGYLPNPEWCEEKWQSTLLGSDQSINVACANNSVAHSFRYGVGPFWDGIFTQSNLIVCTRMSIKLAERPEGFMPFYIRLSDESDFQQACDFIKEALRLYGANIGAINFMDKRRLVAMVSENPNLSADAKLMSEEQVNKLAKQNRLPEWLVVGAVYGDQKTVHAVKSGIKALAEGLPRPLCLSIKLADFIELTLENMSRIWLIKSMLARYLRDIKMLQKSLEIMIGKPNEIALKLPYWWNRAIRPDSTEQPLNPSRDQCGLLWYAPLVKMDSTSMAEFITFVRETMYEHQLDPFITFTCLKHGSLDSTIPILFDLNDSAMTQRANTCLNALYEGGLKKGYLPYRLNVVQQNESKKSSVNHKMATAIKNVIDPNNILAPGRYI